MYVINTTDGVNAPPPVSSPCNMLYLWQILTESVRPLGTHCSDRILPHRIAPQEAVTVRTAYNMSHAGSAKPISLY